MLYYMDREWLKNFRMKKGTFMMLCDALCPALAKQKSNCKDRPDHCRKMGCCDRVAIGNPL